MKILNPNQSYTFRKIFELKAEIDDLVADFGYSFTRTRLNLPQYQEELDRLVQLRDRIKEILSYINLANEARRREILIAPIVTNQLLKELILEAYLSIEREDVLACLAYATEVKRDYYEEILY